MRSASRFCRAQGHWPRTLHTHQSHPIMKKSPIGSRGSSPTPPCCVTRSRTDKAIGSSTRGMMGPTAWSPIRLRRRGGMSCSLPRLVRQTTTAAMRSRTLSGRCFSWRRDPLALALPRHPVGSRGSLSESLSRKARVESAAWAAAKRGSARSSHAGTAPPDAWACSCHSTPH